MAHRHLMAVCVVCLLCAEHLPCKEHVLIPSDNDASSLQQQSLSTYKNSVLTQAADIPGAYLYDKRKDKTKDEVIVRQKRHADHHHTSHHHHAETPEVTKAYVKKLFNLFSNQNTNTMNIDEFENMMKQLDLKQLISSQQKSVDNSSCMDGVEFLEKMTDHHESKEEEEDHLHDHHHEEDHHHHHPSLRDQIKIGADHMLAICPILLYHIVNRQSPLEADGCLNSSNFIASEMFVVDEELEMEPRSKVWLYSTLSIIGMSCLNFKSFSFTLTFLLGVSLCGLFGVAVIPIMEKHFYHHVLQFLVALAVGTLAGDALLHLLPHAMMPIPGDDDIHLSMMLKGLAAVAGIVFFYFFERFLTMITEWRQKKQKRDKEPDRTRVMRDLEAVSQNNGAMATCKHKYSSYPYCYDEIAMETKDDHHEHPHIEAEPLNNHHGNDDKKKVNGNIVDHSFEPDNNTLSTSVDDGSIAESNALYNNNKQAPIIVPAKDSAPEVTIILRWVEKLQLSLHF